VTRECLSSSSQTIKMESNFDATCERECSVCLFDLHLSAAGCHCSPDKYACLNHAKQFCTCAWGSKYFLFRYDAHELNILVEALEGKLSAVYRWARLDLGLALSSYVSQEKMLPVGKEAVKNSTGTDDEISLLKKKMSEAESVLKGRKASSIFHSSHEIEMANHNSRLKKEESIILPSNLRNPVCQLSLEDTSYAVTLLAAEELGVKKPSVLKHDNVILLSDDEGDETEKSVSEKERETSSEKHLEISGRLAGSDYKASLCNYNNERILTAPVTDAAVMGEKKDASSAYGERNNCSPHSMQMKDGDKGSSEPLLGSNPPNLSCHVDSTILELGRKAQDSTTRETSEHDMANSGSYPQNPQASCGGSPKNENKHEKMGINATSNLVDNIRPVTGNPSCTSNNLDRYFRQKGPRIAKVVRRINCNVEPLEFGVVLSGKSWCNSQAIFPKGMLHAFSVLRQ
jgi:hypothetical protein